MTIFFGKIPWTLKIKGGVGEQGGGRGRRCGEGQNVGICLRSMFVQGGGGHYGLFNRVI